MGKKDSEKKEKHSNSPEDALFRDAVGDVQPLRTRNRHRAKTLPPARAVFARRDRASVMDETLNGLVDPAELETGDEMLYARAEVGRRVFRRLRRGRYVIQREIDLHGMTGDEAREALRAFIGGCIADRLRCVRIVHGKGLGSGAAGPVLKSGVNRWLRRWNEVLAFCSAPPCDGGTGAVYVLLRH